MKNLTHYILYIVLTSYCMLLFTEKKVYAQDIHFSQFIMTPLLLDPSQAGKFNGDQRAIINFRDQWRSVASPYKSYGFSFDSQINSKQRKDNFFGIGFSAYSDKSGDINLGLTSLSISLAYHVRLSNESYISGGAQGGFMQSSLDPSKMRFDRQFDNSGHNETISSGETFQGTSFFKPDFSAGVSYSYGTATNAVMSNNGYDGVKTNVGFAVHHVSSPDYSFLEQQSDDLNFKYVLHTMNSFGIRGTNVAIQPSGFIAFQQQATDIVLGTYFRYNLKEKSKFTKFSNGAAFSFGTHYRVGDAFIPSVLIETGSFAFGVSYDTNISGLTQASKGMGGFEISIRFISPNPFGPKRTSRARFN